MARIAPGLVDRIAEKKGIGRSAIYAQIQKIHNDTFLERDLAALVVASKVGISITKYSTPTQRQQVQQHLSGGGGVSAPPPLLPLSASRNSRNKAPRPARKKNNSVFVIGGRDEALTSSMFQLLSALGCKPLEFHQAVAKRGGNPFIGQVLDEAFEQVDALVVLFSPDDVVALKDQFQKPGEKNTEGRTRGQARPNVIFEAGMAMGRHEDKTIMVQVGNMKSFSDIAGRHMVHLDNSFETRNDFAQRLGKLCKVDTTGHEWIKVGNFVPTEPRPKKTSGRQPYS